MRVTKIADSTEVPECFYLEDNFVGQSLSLCEDLIG